MTSNRPSFASSSSRRPSSAIFIGGLPRPTSPPSPDISSSPHSQLPSPPATTSGSTGDSNSTSAGSVGRKGMVNSDKKLSGDEDEELPFDNDEDATAKLNNDLLFGSVRKGKEKESFSSSAIERVKSLTERNRRILDRASSITSSDSSFQSSSLPYSTVKTSVRSRSPMPPGLASSSASSVVSSSSRVSFGGTSSLPHGESGSETEREPSHSKSPQHGGDDTGTIPGPRTRNRTSSITNGRRFPPSSSPTKNTSNFPRSPRKQTPSTTFTVSGTGRRSRTVSIQPGDDEDERQSSVSRASSTSKKSRAPLPREFRSLDGGSIEEGSVSSHWAQDRANANSPNMFASSGTASVAPTSPRRPPKASTVREARRLQRWSSVDEGSLGGHQNEDETPEADDSTRRQWRRTGSAESPLNGKEGRSVVGETLRAAGLSRRGTENLTEEASQRRTRLSGGLGNRPSLNGARDGDTEDLRQRLARSGIGEPIETPPSATGSRFGTVRNIHSVLSSVPSRSGTSMANYDDNDRHRHGSTARTYRSSYSERTSSRNAANHNERPNSSGYGRPFPTAGQGHSAEHARLMLESLTMFEAQLSRIPSTSTAPDLNRVAQSVVQSTNALNALLRAGNLHALEAQIEAEVGDAPAQVDATEIWREVGAEYRETLRMSDELVRTVTQLLLGVGRLVREAVKERSTDSPDLSVGPGSSRSSLDGGDRGIRPARRSTGLDGRRSAEFVTQRESRRSLDEAGSSIQKSIDGNVRPPTSLSITRERAERRSDDGDETAREQNRSSALERLTTRRIFTPKLRDAFRASPMSQDSPGPSQPSPSPAPRTHPNHDRRLPPLTVPQPLPTLPSESLLDQKHSIRRRSKFSNTSTATVRGSSVFSPITSTNPTTALSPQIVSATGEVSTFPLRHQDLSSTLSGLQARDGRQRTLSTVSTSMDGSSGSSGIRALRNSRAGKTQDETGYDHVSPENSRPKGATGERRERRHTLTDVPS